MKQSDFETKVFKAVTQIPFGQTRSYKWLAKRAGYPRAVRAAASVLKKNRDLFVVPCHRVISSDGSPGGYVLGQKIKKMLLDLEHAIIIKQESYRRRKGR
ncbi:methylated-DNA--[protein]-cysteine S-methyltransferase [Candidatus Omnitrophota bacterium]